MAAQNMDPETRSMLTEARELIRQREGKKAALLLAKIDHPVARKWEKKINYAVDWSRHAEYSSEVAANQERGPMPWYLWPLVGLAALWSAGIWFLATGARIEIFLVLCILVVFWGRFPAKRAA